MLTVGNLYPPAGGGGYERIWVSAVEALREAGHQVTVLTSDAPGASPGDDVHRELRWYSRQGEWCSTGPLATLRIEHHNRRVLDRHLDPAPDTVLWMAMGGMSLSLVDRVRRRGIPAVGVVGDGWMRYGPEHDRWLRTPDMEGAARWLFISRATAEGSGFPDGELLHPGVDPARFPHSEPEPWRGQLVFVGRDAPGKGLDTARKAAARAGAQLHVSLPGDGDPAKEIAAADAVLFPSEWTEPWGLVPLEAMSVGRPVIASGTGGSGEYLADGENCLLHTPGDPTDLAGAIARLAGDAELRARLVAGGRETAARYTDRAFREGVVRAIEAQARISSPA